MAGNLTVDGMHRYILQGVLTVEMELVIVISRVTQENRKHDCGLVTMLADT